MASQNPHEQRPDEVEMLDPDEAEEEIPDDPDAPMESDDEDDDAPLEEIQLANDSAAHFDAHKDSIFCIAQHPRNASIVATGGGDDIGYIFEVVVQEQERPPLPASWSGSQQGDNGPQERESLKPLLALEGHTDSVAAIAFTQPAGEYVVTGGMDGRLRAWRDTTNGAGKGWTFVAEAQEVEEISWIQPCPHPDYANTIALGAADGSVWVYSINAADKASPLTIVQAFYLHTLSCTAGAWTPDGRLLATVSEDASFYLWDVFGEAAAAGLTTPSGGQAVVGLTGEDERFRVDGGLYSVAVAPNGSFAAVGGAEGHIRIIGLPRLGADPSATSGARGGGGARNKAGGGKQAGGPKGGTSGAASGQAGAILASLQTQSDSVETISFSAPPLTLMAAGSVDGSIALFDTAHRFAVRRHIQSAHAEEDEEGTEQAVIKVEFVKPTAGQASGPVGIAQAGSGSWLLTSCGNDGVVRRWDTRGGTAAANRGLVGEWRGHRGGGEGGGVMGFVQGAGDKVVTAGDDGVALVFSTPIA